MGSGATISGAVVQTTGGGVIGAATVGATVTGMLGPTAKAPSPLTGTTGGAGNAASGKTFKVVVVASSVVVAFRVVSNVVEGVAEGVVEGVVKGVVEGGVVGGWVTGGIQGVVGGVVDGKEERLKCLTMT